MSEPQSAPAVQVYADYVCPFCYLGYASLDRYRDEREEPLSVDWHPFDLRAGKRNDDGSVDHDVDDGKDEEYYEEARTNVRRLADRYGVEMAQALRTDVDSYDAQRVAWRARDDHPEAFEAFHRSVFDALWEDGRDVGDREVLSALASDAGLPDGYVDEVLADDASAETLETAFHAAQKRGITGVPTFVADRSGQGAGAAGNAARGAVPPEQLRRLVEGR